ncbi:MAG TPA: diguanylate cyclase [Solirubrobacteraceae bacterium]|nr:diguanylate cyclase [Solirubrobacteraceae bacterium]
MAVAGSIGVAFAAMVVSYLGISPSASFDVAWTFSSLAAVLGMLSARSRALPGNRSRWTIWALAAGAWLCGQMAWNVFGIIGFPASPNVADVGWWLFALLVIGSLLRLPQAPRTVQVVAAFESVPVIFAAVALVVAESWSAALHSHLLLAAKISALMYPALYVSATVLMIQAMLAGTLRGARTLAMRLVLGGMVVQSMAFILWGDVLLRGTYVPGTTPLDPLWVVGLSAIAVGGVLAALQPETVARLEEPTGLGVILPAGLFLGLFVAIVVAQVRGLPPGAGMTLRLGLFFSGAALIGRSTLLGRRLKTMLDRERAALAQLEEREGQLARVNEQLVEDSRRDPLTGIGNRRALSDDLPMFETRQREHGEQIAVALCDVDHFKAYNDRLGHLAGDQALRMIAATARGALRSVDTAYRFGGEELLLVLRDVTQEVALLVAERVRMAVQRAGFAHPDGEDGVLTVSIGVACGREEIGQLLGRADAALYKAKRGGRNRVMAADPKIVPAPEPSAGPLTAERVDEGPVPRHLRSMLTVSRAAASGQGLGPVVQALAEAIRSELSFHVVVVNLLELGSDQLRVVIVLGDDEARQMLLGSSLSLAEWQKLLDSGREIGGASWLPAGSYDWQPEGPIWTPTLTPSPLSDAWHPEDMLLLPLRGSDGQLLGVVSVDEPALGRRPSDSEIGVLMAVADHASLALEQVQREAAVAQAGSAELRLAAVMLLAETLDLRDPRTALHSRTVGHLCRITAVMLGLPEERVERVHAAGVLHDLGKLGISDAILQKRGPLGEVEWREMRRHPEVGARILEHAGMYDIAAWIRAHHERPDGRGYPRGIHGESIPLEARILAVADAFEAMIADRSYRPGTAPELARAELRRKAGSQFDPVVVNAFLRALDREQAAGRNPSLAPAPTPVDAAPPVQITPGATVLPASAAAQ